jgi:RNA polymerase sigma-70 factor, ECF subfamily
MDDVQALVARAQRGDGEAFGALYEHFAPKLYSYFHCRVQGDGPLAEDLTEDVFAKVIVKLHTYRDRGIPFGAWLYRIAANRLIDHARRQPRMDHLPADEHHQLPDARAGSAFEGVLTHVELAKALGQLTELQRQVVTLRFLQGMSIAQTVAVVGASEDGVKKLQARGLAALRRALRADALVVAAA